MGAMPIQVRPITGALGAEVHGVDLSADLDEATVAAVRRALLDHCVIFFRDQRFDAPQHKALTRRFDGMTEVESAPLLGFLLEHGHRPEFTCRFRWANGSVAFWDNRSVKHLAVHDAGPFRRVMRRVQIAGDKPS